MVLSSLPLASTCPSGLKATLKTYPLWPCRKFNRLGLCSTLENRLLRERKFSPLCILSTLSNKARSCSLSNSLKAIAANWPDCALSVCWWAISACSLANSVCSSAYAVCSSAKAACCCAISACSLAYSVCCCAISACSFAYFVCWRDCQLKNNATTAKIIAASEMLTNI